VETINQLTEVCATNSCTTLRHTSKQTTSWTNFLLQELPVTIIFLFSVGSDWVHLILRPVFGLLYQPRLIDDECGAIGGMRIGRGNRSTWGKPAPVSLCLPQIPYDPNRARTRAAAVGRRKLTAWVMARPSHSQEIPCLYETWGLITATECLVHTVMPYYFIYFNNIRPIPSSHLISV
jgi:hypothetical protein